MFLQDFWLRLVERGKHHPSSSSNSYLLLFLIDDGNPVNAWNIKFANPLNPEWDTYIPIKLEKLTSFSEEILSQWVEYEVGSLPAKVTAPDIMENSDGGLPELVFDRICNLCGCDWYERVKAWTKY